MSDIERARIVPDADIRQINWHFIRNTLWKLDVQNSAALATTIDVLMGKDLSTIHLYDLEDMLLAALFRGVTP